jgi:hypothetical protein
MMIVLERTYTETQIHSQKVAERGGGGAGNPKRSRNLQPPPICFKETRKQRSRKQNKQTKRERSEWMEGEQRLRKKKEGERILWCCMALGTSISFFVREK